MPPESRGEAEARLPVGFTALKHELNRRVDAVPAGLRHALGVLSLSLGALLLYGPPAVNYDEAYALAWGAQLAGGHEPSLNVVVPPTTHPLTLLTGGGLSAFGGAATSIETWIALLSLGVLAYVAGRLAVCVAGPLAGVVAAILVLTRNPILFWGSLAYLDIPYAALIVGAILLDVGKRPRRRQEALTCLVLAGLLRPEAWLLAAAYAAWSAIRHRRRPPLIESLLVVLAPLLWLATDVVISGRPLYSLTHTSDLTHQIGRGVAAFAVPLDAVWEIGQTMRPGVVAGALVGLIIAWRCARSVAMPPLLAGIAVTATSALLAAAGSTPLDRRYFFVAPVIGCVFCAVAIAELRRPARAPRLVGGLCLLTVLITSVLDVDRVITGRGLIREQRLALERLRTVADRIVSRGCVHVVAPSRLAPWLSVWLHRPPSSFLPRSGSRPVTSLRTAVILPAHDPTAETLAWANGDRPPRATGLPTAAWAHSTSWTVRAAC